jgi:hypothetical protein
MIDKMRCCRACGYVCDFFPWGINGDMPTYFICDCCDIEFGVEDRTYDGVKIHRNKWIENGYFFINNKLKPADWDGEVQLLNVTEND